MPKWEYKREIVDVWLGGEMSEEPLNELGNDGWEIFAVTPVEGAPQTHIAYCKRLIIQGVSNTRDRRKDLIPTEKGFKLKE